MQKSGDAVGALSRLLAAAVRADDTLPVEIALVREACEFFDVSGAVLLSVHEDGAGVVATAPHAGAPPHPRALEKLPPVRELLERPPPVATLAGEAARRVGAALQLERPPAVVLLLGMRVGETIDHLLVLTSESERSFSPEEVELASTFAEAAAASMIQGRLTRQTAARAQQQSALLRAAKTLNESLDLTRVLSRICQEAASILAADKAAVWRGNATDGIVIEATYNFPPEAIGLRLEAGQGLAGKVIQRDDPLIENEYQERIATELPRGSPFADVESVVGVPMHWDGELRGVLAVGYTRRQEIGEESLTLLEAFAELAAVACRNAAAHAGLAHAARTDGLTGCLNHAAFQESLRHEVERVVRTGTRLSLVLLDLDNFKQVNERHGHLVGDEVLRRVGHTLRFAIRPYDLVARYGGDEFAIVVVDASEDDAAEIARRAIDRLATALQDVRKAGSQDSASAGVAEWTTGLTPTELIEEADRALLYGRHEGQRGVVILGSALPPTFRPGRFRREPAPGDTAGPLWPQATEQTERLQKRTRQLALANALGTRLSGMTEPGTILEAAVSEMTRAFGYYLCAAVRVRDDGYVESVAGSGEAYAALDGPWRAPRGAGVIGRCLREHRAVIVNDVTRDPDYIKAPATEAVRSELCVPLWVGETLWGAINVENTELDSFDEDDARLVQTVADQVGSALRSAFLYERLERAYRGTAEALAAALEARHTAARSRSRAIAEHAEAVGARLGLDGDELRDLWFAAILHDVGLIAVPEAILDKPGPLTDSERTEVERHSVVADEILAPVEFLAGVRVLVRHEHERWDGRGYPDGLAGEQIPLGSRIVLACDAYDAMRSSRPYRPALSDPAARQELRRGAGHQFDPRVVDALLEVLESEPGAGVRPAVRPAGARP